MRMDSPTQTMQSIHSQLTLRSFRGKFPRALTHVVPTAAR